MGQPVTVIEKPSSRGGVVRYEINRTLTGMGHERYVAGEDVTNGKPAPDCFLLAAQRLSQHPHDCLVFEDAPAGIRAAEAAGTRVVVVTATHTHRFETAHPTIPGYDALAPLTDAAGRLVIAGLAGRAA